MEWLNMSDDELKDSIMSILIELSKIDGKVDAKELLYLLDIGNIYGFDDSSIRSKLYKSQNQIVIPGSEQERMTILYFLLFMMKIDGKITIQEENLIFHYGFKLGFNESLIREMIVVIKEHMGKRLPPDSLLSKVKKYLN
jgi:hypothetical protein